MLLFKVVFIDVYYFITIGEYINKNKTNKFTTNYVLNPKTVFKTLLFLAREKNVNKTNFLS